MRKTCLLLLLLLLVPLLLLIAACGGSPESYAPDGAATPPVAAVATPSATDDCPAPSSSPAAGRIAGLTFAVADGSIKEGTLELREQDAADSDLQLTLFLFLDEGEVPAGRSFEVDADSGYGSPHVHTSWKGGSDAIIKDYRMRLSFDQERDGVLPGTIHLCLPDDAASFVSGSFEAKIEGFRLVDGKPDLSLDGLKNFDYIALDYLQAEFGADVEIESAENKMFTHPGPSGHTQIGVADVTFIDDGEQQAHRFAFVKLDGLWQVDRVFGMHELPEAHPYDKPSAAKHSRDQFAWIAAREIEKRTHASHPGVAIYPANGYSVLKSYRPKKDGADITAAYRLGDSEEEIELLFEVKRSDDEWQIVSIREPAIQQASLGKS